MRFQGEICTLSYGLQFNEDQVLLNGTISLGRGSLLPKNQQIPRLHFNSLLSEAEMASLQEWLANGSAEPFSLPDPIRQIRRLTDAGDGVVRLEMDFHLDQEPDWWNWEVTSPLKITLSITSNEFAYLTQTLNRKHWSAEDLTW